MELYDEDELRYKAKKKGNNITKIILILIVLVIILIIGIIGLILYLKENSNTITIRVNEQIVSGLEEIIYVDESNISYVPIKEFASYVGYKAYNGDYTELSEDTTKCYVQNDYETALFTADSILMYKLEKGNSDYEYYYLDHSISYMDEKLYITLDDAMKAFNISISYDEKTKKIDIYTLDYLIESYTPYATQYGYAGVDEKFVNQRTALDDMLVVKDENSKYGVIDIATGKAILETKYDSIEYIQYASSFMVQSNGKVGIISSKKESKVPLLYDKLQLIDKDENLYLAQKGNLYGVINIDGKIIIHLEYDKIGIDIDNFKNNGIKNGYVILNKLIPVKQNNKWAFFTLKGEEITDFSYDKIGYTNTGNKNQYSLLAISDYNVIVVGKENKYSLIKVDGTEIYQFVFDEIYIQVSGGEISYLMSYNNGKIANVTEQLDKLGLGKTDLNKEKEEKKNSNSEESGNNVNNID